jgi:hypothetical protein
MAATVSGAKSTDVTLAPFESLVQGWEEEMEAWAELIDALTERWCRRRAGGHDRATARHRSAGGQP